jgi:hypothetical protein
MSAPDVSNRDRLLRLIDGGQEVLKEVQEERTAKSVDALPKDPNETPKKPSVQDFFWGAKIAFSDKDLLRLVKLLGLFALIFVCLHYTADILKTLKKDSKSSVPGPVDLAPKNEPGIGLRLVGVDSSDPPVALLEDLKTGKTYFARLNDRVGDTRVKQIQKNKVLVSVRGKTVELR